MLLSVQILRAIAAVLVVVCHAVHKQGQLSGDGRVWELGGSGVDLFFIISGFIMCHVTAGRRTTAREFLFARFMRIVPLYWTLTLVALAAYIAHPALVNSSGGVTDVFGSFVLFPSGAKFLIQTGWTLSYEFWFYIVFAASLRFALRGRLFFVSAVMLGLVVLGRVARPADFTARFLTDPLLLEFVMGIGAYLYLRSTVCRPLCNLLLLTVGLFALVGLSVFDLHVNRVLTYGMPFMLIFCAIAGSESAIRSISRSAVVRACCALGDASYSLYLSHPFALAAAAFAVRHFGIQRHAAVSVALLCLVALLVGYACYSVVEVNLNRYAKATLGRLRRVAQPADQRF
jgi:exopolysaccharide production protein ExoZ